MSQTPVSTDSNSSTVVTPSVSIEQRLRQRERPSDRCVMSQSWQELLFLHWRIDAEEIAARLPPGLHVDTFEDQAWIGVVPFFMRNIRPWWAPTVPGISNFQELNLRTYVVDENGTPGVWFFSLDAHTRLGVWWARTFFRLPYFYARMTHEWDRNTGRVQYRSRRPGTDKTLECHYSWNPTGDAKPAEPGTLEFFLVERYVLFADGGNGKLASGRVHHTPYEVSPVDAIMDDSLFELNGFDRPDRAADHMLVSRGVDVEIFPLQKS